jgi:hypothetical protein
MAASTFSPGSLVLCYLRSSAFICGPFGFSKRELAADERRSAIQQTAPQNDCPAGKFRVIHPFHPLYQQQLDEIGRTRRWGDERVWFRTASGDLRTIPLRFTSLAASDPYLQWGGGKSWHRVAELVELSRLMDGLRDAEVGNV